MSDTLVSVILPVYNVDKYLEVCIESVLGQDYRSLEVLLVDDGSTDSSPGICERCGRQDERVRVLHKQNGGLASARNAGLDMARGEYVYFVDSDDCIHPSLIGRAVRLMEEHGAAIVQVGLQMVEEGFRDYTQPAGEGRTQVFTREEALRNLDRDDRSLAGDIRLATTVVWDKLYRRRLFDAIRFREALRIHEDQMIIHRLIAAAGGMVFYDAPLYYYRSNQGSLIRGAWKPAKLVILDCYEDRLACAEGLPDTPDKAGLVSLFYDRYLTCIFKNYLMVTVHLEGEERKRRQKELQGRMKSVLRAKRGRMAKKRRLFFEAFSRCPGGMAALYRAVKKES